MKPKFKYTEKEISITFKPEKDDEREYFAALKAQGLASASVYLALTTNEEHTFHIAVEASNFPVTTFMGCPVNHQFSVPKRGCTTCQNFGYCRGPFKRCSCHGYLFPAPVFEPGALNKLFMLHGTKKLKSWTTNQ